MGTVFSGAKVPGRDFDHSPPTKSEVKNECIYTIYRPSRQCTSMAWSGTTLSLGTYMTQNMKYNQIFGAPQQMAPHAATHIAVDLNRP
jgi:hypothetical protein